MTKLDWLRKIEKWLAKWDGTRSSQERNKSEGT